MQKTINPNKIIVVKKKWKKWFQVFPLSKERGRQRTSIFRWKYLKLKAMNKKYFIKRNMMWNAAPSSKCHLCVNGAFAKIIKCLKYINDWWKEKRRKNAEENISLNIRYRRNWVSDAKKWFKTNSIVIDAGEDARLMPPLTLGSTILEVMSLSCGIPFTQYWFWV